MEKPMKIVKDEKQRLRILDSLTISEARQLEIDSENKVKIWYKNWRKCSKSYEITELGMLYEIAAMVSYGWLKRVSAHVKTKGISAYKITQAGLDILENDLRPRILDQIATEMLATCNTHSLLAMLDYSRSGSYEGPSSEKIKAELAKRPHVMNSAERRKKFFQTEKGDVRRVRQKRRKQTA
jgi:hypothetical protein